MANWILPTELASWISRLAGLLHASNAGRLQPLLVGMLFARGRRTVSNWQRAGEFNDDYQNYYYFLVRTGPGQESYPDYRQNGKTS